MVKCCAYQLSRSAGRILFGYQNSTNPGSDQLAVPTKILPPSFDSDAFATTSQTKSRRQRTQIRFSEIDCLNCDDAERSRRHEQSVVRSSFFSQRLQRPSICKGNVALRCRFVTRLPRCHAQFSRALARLRRAWANDRP